jgi:hypothetical protein
MSQDPRTLNEELLSMVAHELRTPLTALKGNLQLAQMRISAPSGVVDLQEVAAMLARADQKADHMARLVSDLLDVTRIHTGKFSLDVAHCTLGGLVQEAVSEFSQLFPQRAIHLRPWPCPVPVLADAMRVKQVVANAPFQCHQVFARGSSHPGRGRPGRAPGARLGPRRGAWPVWTRPGAHLGPLLPGQRRAGLTAGLAPGAGPRPAYLSVYYRGPPGPGGRGKRTRPGLDLLVYASAVIPAFSLVPLPSAGHPQ